MGVPSSDACVGIRTNTDDVADEEIFEVDSELSMVAGVFGKMLLGL